MILDEPIVLNGMRAWYKTQLLYTGVPTNEDKPVTVTASWYGTGVDDNEGAFALARTDGPFEPLVGDLVQVRCGHKTIYVYVIGRSGELATDFALARRAWLALVDLARDEASLSVQRIEQEPT